MPKMYRNGILCDMTEADIAESNRQFQAVAKPEPTPEDRLAALEADGLERDKALMELAALLAGGV